MYELFIIERQLANIKYAIYNYKGIKRLKFKIKYWWLKKKYNKLKRKYERRKNYDNNL